MFWPFLPPFEAHFPLLTPLERGLPSTPKSFSPFYRAWRCWWTEHKVPFSSGVHIFTLHIFLKKKKVFGADTFPSFKSIWQCWLEARDIRGGCFHLGSKRRSGYFSLKNDDRKLSGFLHGFACDLSSWWGDTRRSTIHQLNSVCLATTVFYSRDSIFSTQGFVTETMDFTVQDSFSKPKSRAFKDCSRSSN